MTLLDLSDYFYLETKAPVVERLTHQDTYLIGVRQSKIGYSLIVLQFSRHCLNYAVLAPVEN